MIFSFLTITGPPVKGDAISTHQFYHIETHWSLGVYVVDRAAASSTFNSPLDFVQSPTQCASIWWRSFPPVNNVTVTPVFLIPLLQICSSLITRPPVKGDVISTHQFYDTPYWNTLNEATNFEPVPAYLQCASIWRSVRDSNPFLRRDRALYSPIY